VLSAPREVLVGVRAGYRQRPDSRGVPGSFKCPVYSTDTLHPLLTSLAEDMLVHGVTYGSSIGMLPCVIFYGDVGSHCYFYESWLYGVVRVRLVFLKDHVFDDRRGGLTMCYSTEMTSLIVGIDNIKIFFSSC